MCVIIYVCVCMCVCVYVCKYVCVYMYVCNNMCVCVYVCTCILIKYSLSLMHNPFCGRLSDNSRHSSIVFLI